MSEALLWSLALPPIAALVVVAWIVATLRANVGLVDIFWSLFFLGSALTYAAVSPLAATL